jgi:hypothetical protein
MLTPRSYRETITIVKMAMCAPAKRSQAGSELLHGM